MQEEEMTLENFAKPPQKVCQMFHAVIELIGEKVDIGTMKVADITKRAGIGKGTAYEYFSSKEEIISLALLYHYKERLEELEQRIMTKKTFQEKMYGILDWIEENATYQMTFWNVAQMSAGNKGFCNVIKEKVPEQLLMDIHQYMLKRGDELMELGFKEGLFQETNVVKRRMAFTGMLAQIGVLGSACRIENFFPIDAKSARDFAYEGMLKALRTSE